MATLNSDSRPIIGRGPSLGARFFFLALISVGIMVLDHRQGALDSLRQWLLSGVYPVFRVVDVPFNAWDWVGSSFADRSRLREENGKLAGELRVANLRLQRLESLTEENRLLRDLRTASAGIADRSLIAEILRVDLDPFRHRVLINKGANVSVYKGQAVLAADGVFGQVERAGLGAAEVILITDSEHATPVQVNRNGLRTIAVGTGEIGKLTLPFLTVDSDVKVGDLLITSGLGGIYPAGYPVAEITKVERDAAETFAIVEAKPLARLDRDREVLLIWSEPVPSLDSPPAAPAGKAAAAAPTPKPTP
ncbi:MAG: rod shape-determining protein MreC [Steroidobacteraceae bacterium]